MDQHLFYKGPEEFRPLRSMYWWLRQVRSYDNAKRVYWYRKIKVERQRLEKAGFSAEHVRLYCRYMSNPQMDCPALRRLWAYEEAVLVFNGISNTTRIKGTVIPHGPAGRRGVAGGLRSGPPLRADPAGSPCVVMEN